jgi:hypothetical protein
LATVPTPEDVYEPKELRDAISDIRSLYGTNLRAFHSVARLAQDWMCEVKSGNVADERLTAPKETGKKQAVA